MELIFLHTRRDKYRKSSAIFVKAIGISKYGWFSSRFLTVFNNGGALKSTMVIWK